MKLSWLSAVFFLHSCCRLRADEFHFDPDSEENKAHLQEDLDGNIDKKVSEMNTEELQFHYFKQHDYDNNQRLDGIELLSKLYRSEFDNQKKAGGGVFSLEDDYIGTRIDGYLASTDLNNDGYVDFVEYKNALNLSKK